MATPEGRYVKGSVVLDYAMMVRANPDLPWSDHLSADELDQVKQMILPGSWYPIQFFQRIGLAVFKLVAKESNPLLRAYGASLADRLNEDHPGMVTEGSPRDTLEKYVNIQRSFYSFDAFEIEEKAPTRLLVHIYSTPEEVEIPVYIEQICGMVERLLELSGRPDAEMKLTNSEDNGQVTSTMDVSWED